GINLHRRHTIGHDHLTNHRAPALNHHVAVHGERTNTTFNVTTHTALDQDGCDFRFIVRYISQVTITGREGCLTVRRSFVVHVDSVHFAAVRTIRSDGIQHLTQLGTSRHAGQ